MKIILCSLNSKFIHSSLGVWYLYSAYKQQCSSHAVVVYEATINNPIEDIVADLWAKKPKVIGFSCYIWNIEYIKKIAQTLKLLDPAIKIFFGGPEASFDAQSLIEKPFVDFIIKGEGEQPFIDLLKTDFSATKEIIQGDKACKDYYNPYSAEYFEKLNKRICYLETSRGCPFSCAFCLSGRDENVRFFDMETSKKNIIALANSGTQTVKFVDRTFNCDDNRALEIFKFICEEKQNGNIPNGVIFHFEIEADIFTTSTLEYLATVPKGSFQFEAGLQSFNVDTLKEISRRSDVARLVNNLKAIARAGNIHLHIDLIAGLPFEGYDSFKKGFDQAYKIKANVIQLGFLKLLKGSSLENNRDSYGYKSLHYAPYQVLSNDYIGYDDMLKLKCTEDAVERLLNSGRFANTIGFLLQATELSPYDLFYKIGNYTQNESLQSPSLDSYTSACFEYFKGYDGIDEKKLRDAIAYDRITTDRTGKLFSCLHVSDSRLKHISIAIKNKDFGIFAYQCEKAKQSQIGFCILYSGEKEMVLFADYTDYNPVNGIYENATLDLEKIIERDL